MLQGQTLLGHFNFVSAKSPQAEILPRSSTWGPQPKACFLNLYSKSEGKEAHFKEQTWLEICSSRSVPTESHDIWHLIECKAKSHVLERQLTSSSLPHDMHAINHWEISGILWHLSLTSMDTNKQKHKAKIGISCCCCSKSKASQGHTTRPGAADCGSAFDLKFEAIMDLFTPTWPLMLCWECQKLWPGLSLSIITDSVWVRAKSNLRTSCATTKRHAIKWEVCLGIGEKWKWRPLSIRRGLMSLRPSNKSSLLSLSSLGKKKKNTRRSVELRCIGLRSSSVCWKNAKCLRSFSSRHQISFFLSFNLILSCLFQLSKLSKRKTYLQIALAFSFLTYGQSFLLLTLKDIGKPNQALVIEVKAMLSINDLWLDLFFVLMELFTFCSICSWVIRQIETNLFLFLRPSKATVLVIHFKRPLVANWFDSFWKGTENLILKWIWTF